MKTKPEICPVCDKHFTKENPRTRHHIFPRFWYKSNVVVYACHICHQVEFHHMFTMRTKVWSVQKCITTWVRFCRTHNKNAFVIYPFLKNLSYDND